MTQFSSSASSNLVFSNEEELLGLKKECGIKIPFDSIITLHNDLKNQFGLDRLKQIFFQLSYSIGQELALSMSDDNGGNPVSTVMQGFDQLNTMGLGQIMIDAKEIDTVGNAVASIDFRGRLVNYEKTAIYQANKEVNLNLNGILFCGVASGYVSTIVQQDIFFKERLGAEAEVFQWDARLLRDWNADDYAVFMEAELPILRELAIVNKKMEKEHSQLKFVTNVHNALTNELLQTSQLSEIIKVLKEYIPLPIVIDNGKGQIKEFENIDEEKLSKFNASFQMYLEKRSVYKLEFIVLKDHGRLVSPIYLQGSLVGYCSFIYPLNNEEPEEIEEMILGRLSSICALVYLNGKNAIASNERTKGILFEKIIAKDFETNDQVIRELKLLNIEISGYYHIAYVSLKFKTIKEEENLSIFTSIYHEVIEFFREKEFEVLLLQKASGILCFIPGHLNEFDQGPEEFYARIQCYFPKIDCHIGISTSSNCLTDVSSYIDEAFTAERFTTNSEPLLRFHELGILGILIHSQEESSIKKLAQNELGVLYGHSPQQLEYLETLYYFLLNGGNLENTAKQLMLSISGLRYRMSKIRQMLDDELRDADRQFQLLLALKALKLIGEF